MKRGEEILAEHVDYVGREQNFWPKHHVVAAIESAQREAWNEAVAAAANVVWRFRDQPGRAIYTAVRSLHRKQAAEARRAEAGMTAHSEHGGIVG